MTNQLEESTTVRLWRDTAQDLLDALALEYQAEQIATARSEEAFEAAIRTYQGQQ